MMVSKMYLNEVRCDGVDWIHLEENGVSSGLLWGRGEGRRNETPGSKKERKFIDQLSDS
jgi:hypothetical protein